VFHHSQTTVSPESRLNALIANHLAIRLTPAESPRSAASAINYMQRGVKKKSNGASPKCVSCGGAHPANFTECPSYQQQLNFLHQRQLRLLKPSSTFQYKQAHFPALEPPTSLPRPQNTWAQAAPQRTNTTDTYPLSTVFESVKSVLTMFDIQKLCHCLRS
jgi:hypothetical protein